MTSDKEVKVQIQNIPIRVKALLNTNNDDGFVHLFNGQSLDDDGWCMAGLGRFQVISEERALKSEDGMGLLWYTKKRYKNFILKIEWKVKHKSDNSGIFVRFSNPGNDPWIAVNTGYEIQIDDLAMPDGDPVHKTGAIYDFAAPTRLASKPVAEWNNFEIQAIDQKYTVVLNNKKMIPSFFGNRLTKGYIGIQNHDADSLVSFRNIMIKEIFQLLLRNQ